MCIFSERGTECCGVYCCLLYIGHGSLEYSCHTHTLSMTTLLLLILFPLIRVFFFPGFVALPVDSSDFFLYSFFFFYVVLFTSPSLSLCYIVKLTSSSQQVRVQILFLVDITWLCFLGSGFLWEGRNANVSTLYNDGQLCIYCLFIVDLYMKRNEYIIYIYISIHNEILWSCFWSWKMTFHGPYVHSALFRVLLKAPFTVLGYRRLRVE